jgi:hypothetical protein
MNRRTFLTSVIANGALSRQPRSSAHTAHLIFINNGGGVRRQDYYENPVLAPNVRRIAHEGYVFVEDHCEQVASHEAAVAELLQGRESKDLKSFPTILDYVGYGVQLASIEHIPRVMEQYRPRIVVCRHAGHDVGHERYESYLRSVQTMDVTIGNLFDWIKTHPYFANNTAIVIRPEFGRDDEVNEHGQLHHSYGFYSTHRVASIFWGPDFNRGVDRTTVIGSRDLAPTLASAFGFDSAPFHGRILPGLFKPIQTARIDR